MSNSVGRMTEAMLVADVECPSCGDEGPHAIISTLYAGWAGEGMHIAVSEDVLFECRACGVEFHVDVDG